MTTQRLGGTLLLCGSLLFLIAAFMPISWVFAERVAEKKLEMINAAPGSWKLAQVFFGTGAVIAAIGFFPAYLVLRSKNAQIASLTAFLLAFIGSLLWAWHTYLRAIDPQAFAHRLLHPRWLAGVYFVLTQLALLSFGIALLQARYPRWIGWLNAGAAIAFSILLALFGDLPPFVYYVIMGVTAVLFVKGS